MNNWRRLGEVEASAVGNGACWLDLPPLHVFLFQSLIRCSKKGGEAGNNRDVAGGAGSAGTEPGGTGNHCGNNEMKLCKEVRCMWSHHGYCRPWGWHHHWWPAPFAYYWPTMTRNDEALTLQREARILEDQLHSVKSRLEELKKQEAKDA